MDTTREMYEAMRLIGLDAIGDFMQRGQNNYGDAFIDLGSRGQFSEIWRKVKKLKRGVWEDIELQGETPEQVAKELIPHLLMMIYCLRREGKPRIVRRVDELRIGTAMEDIKAGDSMTLDCRTGHIRRST